MVMTGRTERRVLVAGAAGLIGCFVAADLARRGYPVVAVARTLGPAARFGLGSTSVLELPLVEHDTETLAQLLADQGIDVVVNCLGVLQDGPGASTHEVHVAFVGRLVAAIGSLGRPVLLSHVAAPGLDIDDRTAFSLTKRRGEHLIRDSGIPYAILRPGFVMAPAAYGGSALHRALAALPFDLPARDLARPLATIAVEDVAATIAFLVEHWAPDSDRLEVTFDLMHPDTPTLGRVLDLLRCWLGRAGGRRVALSDPVLRLGTAAAELAARLGWAPPMRATALAELRRGVSGNPHPWIEATGIQPRALVQMLTDRPATVQEKWFAGLYLLKPLAIATLTVFWAASGLIALTVAYDAAVATLTDRGFGAGPAQAITIASSAVDIAIGIAIAVRRTCRPGLLAGIAVSVGYMLGAAILTPDLWVEPLGALVKTGPAIVLMLMVLAILEKR